MSTLNDVTGGQSNNATQDEQDAINSVNDVSVPLASQLTLPELQQYAVEQNMTPAQTQAFLQANNALAQENIGQQGTEAQQAAINQLANVANAGATGTPQEQAQIAQALEQSNTNLAGQRGSIDQQAEARGVSPGLLQAALGQQNAGQDAQNANAAALAAQGQAYQTAVNALAQGAGAGQALQGQQNTQANTVAAAQNAMQQFNAANQQNAATTNAANQQQANATNAQNANTVSQANTGLANQRTQYNAEVPETLFNNEMQKATGQAQQQQNAAQNATAQGQQNAGIYSGLLGTAGTVIGGIYGGPAGAAAGGALGNAAGNAVGNSATANGSDSYSVGNSMPATATAAHGMLVPSEEGYCRGGMMMKQGGMIPGKAKVPGDSKVNDTVPIRVSPGEAVIPRTSVQQNPIDTMRLLAGKGSSQPRPMPQQPVAGHHPQDIAALLMAMKQMRGGK